MANSEKGAAWVVILDLVFKVATVFLIPAVILIWTLRSDVQLLGFEMKNVARELKRINDRELPAIAATAAETAVAFRSHLVDPTIHGIALTKIHGLIHAKDAELEALRERVRVLEEKTK